MAPVEKSTGVFFIIKYSMFNPNIFCPLPFIQTVVRTDGFLYPCCNSPLKTHNIKEDNIEEYFQSKFLQNLRSDMMNGIKNEKICNKCYKEEEKYGRSMRTENLDFYKFKSKKYYNKLIDYYDYKNKKFPEIIEFHLGNICNLKCLTCRPEDSSLFLSEDKILKISNYDQKNYNLNETLIKENIKLIFENDVKIIDLRGGESMLVPSIKKILLEIPTNLCKNKKIRIQTNGTIFDNDWENIFKKFSNVEITLSIDAYGNDNNYIRFPSDWQKIEKNINFFKNITNQINVNCTVSNLNFFNLFKLIDWFKTKKLSLLHFSILTYPSYFHYTNLPESIFYEAADKLKENLTDFPELKSLISLKPNNHEWEKFCKMINLRDSYRKNSIFDILPDFKNFWVK